MRSKSTYVISDSENSDSPVPFTLSPLAIEDLTDEPVYSFTPEGQNALEGQTLLDAITAFDWRPGDLAKDFQIAQDAHRAVMQDSDHETFLKAQEAFNKACRLLFFNLQTMVGSHIKAVQS